MKKSTLIAVFLLILCLSGYAQSHKRNYTYKYDATGNRTQRVYTLLTCPTCRNTITDSTNAAIADSLYSAAVKNPITLPPDPTEKISGKSTELKNIYPNPTQGNFVLEFTQNINANLQVMDVKGNKMDEIKIDGSEWQIDLSLFPAGEYILIIRTTEGRTYTKKILKI